MTTATESAPFAAKSTTWPFAGGSPSSTVSVEDGEAWPAALPSRPTGSTRTLYCEAVARPSLSASSVTVPERQGSRW